MRILFREFLALLTKLVLKKHHPVVIAITGKGATAVTRELVFQVVNIAYPAVQNMQSPIVEFSIPLTIIGVKGYPENTWQWLKVFVKAVVQLFKLNSFEHYLVLELNTINKSTSEYWLNVLKPDYLIDTSSLAADANLAEYKKLAVEFGVKLGVDEDVSYAILEDFNFSGSGLKLYKGLNGCLVIDATYHFYPTSETLITEFLESITTANEFSAENIVVVEQDSVINKKLGDIDGKTIIVIKGFAPIMHAKYGYLMQISR